MKKYTDNMKDVVKFADEAQRIGMSYGQYVAYLDNLKKRASRRALQLERIKASCCRVHK